VNKLDKFLSILNIALIVFIAILWIAIAVIHADSNRQLEKLMKEKYENSERN